ncbi:hypothetical protein V8C26DRAFT_393848 [Trichoderma gracile]
MKVAGLERVMVQVCQEALLASLDEGMGGKLEAFIDVTNLFDQIHVARDIASRMQKHQFRFIDDRTTRGALLKLCCVILAVKEIMPHRYTAIVQQVYQIISKGIPLYKYCTRPYLSH